VRFRNWIPKSTFQTLSKKEQIYHIIKYKKFKAERDAHKQQIVLLNCPKFFFYGIV